MSELKQPIASSFSPPHGSLRGYTIGFVTSLALTVAAFTAATAHGTSRNLIIGIIAVLGVTQFVIQLIYFLHLADEFKPRWKLAVFWLMLTIVFILVAGSIWIMTNLNYHMRSPQQVQTYVESQDGL